MNKRTSTLLIYFGIIICTLLLRISFQLKFVESAFSDQIWDICVQVFIFGTMPLFLYFVINKQGNILRVGNIFTDFGFRKLGWKNMLLVIPTTMLMIFISMCIVNVWSDILTLLGYTKVTSEIDYYNVGVLFRELFFTACLPGFFEEFTHRGFLFAGLKGNTKGVWLIILTSVFFGFMHQNVYQIIYTIVDGAVMGLVTYYTGSIFSGMLCHVCNNAFNVLLDYLYQISPTIKSIYNSIYMFMAGNIFGVLMTLFLFIASIILLVLIFMYYRKQAVNRDILPSSELVEKFTIADIVLIVGIIMIGIVAVSFSFVWGLML